MTVIVVQELVVQERDVSQVLAESEQYLQNVPISGRIDARVVQGVFPRGCCVAVSRWRAREDYARYAERRPNWIAPSWIGRSQVTLAAARYFEPLYSFEAMLDTGAAFACIFLEGSPARAARRRATVLAHVQSDLARCSTDVLRYIVAEEAGHPENLLVNIETRTVERFMAGRSVAQVTVAIRLALLGCVARVFFGRVMAESESGVAGDARLPAGDDPSGPGWPGSGATLLGAGAAHVQGVHGAGSTLTDQAQLFPCAVRSR